MAVIYRVADVRAGRLDFWLLAALLPTCINFCNLAVDPLGYALPWS
jgi:hypothetical protein